LNLKDKDLKKLVDFTKGPDYPKYEALIYKYSISIIILLIL
jgi:hypothetical protein